MPEATDPPCSRCGKLIAPHEANGKRFCCVCYEKVVNKLLEVIEEIRQAIK